MTLPAWFTHKRLVLLAGRRAREIASVGWLTPARADLLGVLIAGPVRQCDLVDELGVCDSVVSRMLDSLEELSIVERTRDPRDKRINLVGITEYGRDLLGIVRDELQRALDEQPGLDPLRTLAGHESVQFGAELLLMDDWQHVASRFRATLAPISLIPQRLLLRLMRSTIWRDLYPPRDFGEAIQQARARAA